MKIYCIAALRIELEWLLGKLSRPERRKDLPGLNLWQGRLGSCDAALVICGIGAERARQAMVTLAAHYELKRVLHLGVCGALTDNLGLYRPVLAGTVMATYCQVEGPVRLQLPGPEVFSGLKESLRPVAGSIVTHSQPVFSRHIRDRLRQRFGADCVDLESWELAAFCREHGISLTVVKAVSDFADETSSGSFSRHARQAARAAGQVACAILDSLRD